MLTKLTGRQELTFSVVSAPLQALILKKKKKKGSVWRSCVCCSCVGFAALHSPSSTGLDCSSCSLTLFTSWPLPHTAATYDITSLLASGTGNRHRRLDQGSREIWPHHNYDSPLTSPPLTPGWSLFLGRRTLVLSSISFSDSEVTTETWSHSALTVGAKHQLRLDDGTFAEPPHSPHPRPLLTFK